MSRSASVASPTVRQPGSRDGGRATRIRLSGAMPQGRLPPAANDNRARLDVRLRPVIGIAAIIGLAVAIVLLGG